MIRNQKNIFLWLCVLGFSGLSAMNLLHRPYDTLLIPEINLEKYFEIAFWVEKGVRPARAYNANDNLVNPLAVWECNQDALAMLEGFPDGSKQTNLLNILDATDNGVRGHVCFSGNLNLEVGGAFGARWYFLPHAWITALVPFYKMSLTDIMMVDLTQNLTAADMRVQQYLTQPLAMIVGQLGNGLSLAPWKRTGFGDLNLLCEFLFNFPQERPLLKEVQVGGRAGFTLPTGLHADEDKLLALPFGYDGAVGILFAGALNVVLGERFKAGLDVQLLHLFGNTRWRRIKTSFDQTNLLLLAKEKAYKDYGLTQRFNLFIQGYHLVGGLSLLIGYQFLKQGESHLALDSCDYSSSIANSAASLDEWIMHSVEFNLHYDFDEYACGQLCIEPQVSFFARLPFGGKRAITFTTAGVMLSLDF